MTGIRPKLFNRAFYYFVYSESDNSNLCWPYLEVGFACTYKILALDWPNHTTERSSESISEATPIVRLLFILWKRLAKENYCCSSMPTAINCFLISNMLENMYQFCWLTNLLLSYNKVSLIQIKNYKITAHSHSPGGGMTRNMKPLYQKFST